MKKISEFFNQKIQLLEVKFSIYLNRHVFVMTCTSAKPNQAVHWYSRTLTTLKQGDTKKMVSKNL